METSQTMTFCFHFHLCLTIVSFSSFSFVSSLVVRDRETTKNSRVVIHTAKRKKNTVVMAERKEKPPFVLTDGSSEIRTKDLTLKGEESGKKEVEGMKSVMNLRNPPRSGPKCPR